jgi:4-diphosphocytidyl-2-C-methyl-D-erythritol kinase
MNTTEKAYAKINLSIDIVSRMPDGYHNMLMVMQSVSLHDELTVSVEKGAGLAVSTDLKYLPSDNRNIAARAAAVFYEHTGITGYRTHIDIKKHIPVGAGLGGGSADGAAVLRALNRLFDTKLGREALETLPASVGSDIPFCVSGGTALAEGRGDKLRDLEPLEPCYIVICKPGFAISTPELFSKIRVEKIRLRPDTNGLLDALNAHSLGGVARRMYNVFEEVLPKGTSDILDIKSRLNDYNALGTIMTGTGSAVFGLFEEQSMAEAALDSLKKRYKESFLAVPIKRLQIEA